MYSNAEHHTPKGGEETLAIQDLYAPAYRHCFGCGADNPHGWHIKSYWKGETVVSNFTPDEHLTGGVPNNLYGGAIAAILDCHGTAAAAAFYHHAQGYHLGQEPLARCVTASLTVNYIRPTPMGVSLTLIGTLDRIEERKVYLNLAVTHGTERYCEGKMLAIRVKE